MRTSRCIFTNININRDRNVLEIRAQQIQEEYEKLKLVQLTKNRLEDAKEILNDLKVRAINSANPAGVNPLQMQGGAMDFGAPPAGAVKRK
jgi:hypothetical protein